MLSSWQLQWQVPNGIRPQPDQSVYGATLSAEQSTYVTATKLPQAAAIAGDGGNTALQIHLQLPQQEAPGNISSSDDGKAVTKIALSNLIFNGISCSQFTDSNSNIAPSTAIGSLTFQPSPIGGPAVPAPAQECSFDEGAAEGSWAQGAAYELPSACQMQFCCGARLPASPDRSTVAVFQPSPAVVSMG